MKDKIERRKKRLNDKERLDIYERNQMRLIKAITQKVKENKTLKERNTDLMLLCMEYETFLTEEQMNAAKIMAEALSEKAKKVMLDEPT